MRISDVSVRHRLYCRFCKKTSIPLIKSSLNTYKIQYYSCNNCNTERLKKYRSTKLGMENVRKAVYRSIKKYQYKQNARVMVRTALEGGKIEKPSTCQGCEKIKKVEGHHTDYSRPLELRWLCRQCHAILHKK